MAPRADRFILAVDAGGSYSKYALCHLDGMPAEGSFGLLPIDSSAGADAVLSAFSEVRERASERADSLSGSIVGVGVSVPGPFDFEGGRSLMRHKFASIHGIPLRPTFSGGRDIPVVFEQDAIAFLLGERGAGAARGYSAAAACTLGTGLGYACVSEGKVLRNELGSPHLGLYKTPFKDGIAEDYVSARAIAGRWRELCRPGEESLGAKEIAALAAAGDERAARVYADTGRYLGEALLEEARKREFQCLVLGGQISKSFGLMAPALREALKGCGSLKAIRRAERLDDAALIGVALEAAEKARS